MTLEIGEEPMRATPTARHGDALAVIDNERRMRWHRPDPVTWVPAGVWPSAEDALSIHRHLDSGLPLLVILDGPQTTVRLLIEELAGAAPDVVARVACGTREPALVRIPALDWLPEDLRRSGLAFLDVSAEHAHSIPPVLRPPLVLSTSDPAAPHVRFAHRLRKGFNLDDHLHALVEHAFGATLDLVAVG